MERLTRAERLIQVVVTSGLVLGAQFQQDSIIPLLRSVLGENAAGPVLYSIAMVVIVGAFELVGATADRFFEKATWARRLVLRDQFVEGQWADVVVAPDGDVTGGIVEIFYRDGELKISGTTYDREGKWIGTFFSKHSMLCDNELIYVYTKDPQARAEPDSHGFGTYTFRPSPWRSPTEFNGFFSSRQSAQDCRVHGRKVIDAPLRDDEERGEYVRRFLARHESRRARQEGSTATG
jgi:hypothetical protein